jgi:hypothetical protein
MLVLAELVFALVASVSDVNENDKPDMAFTLRHVGDDEAIGAIEEALGYLIDKKRIVEESRTR